jgi:septal ring factor EnvC (AmiA/AmiB activator)
MRPASAAALALALATAGASAQPAPAPSQQAREREDLVRLLGALALFRRDPPPALLTPSRSIRDAVRGQILARALIPQLQARVRALDRAAVAPADLSARPPPAFRLSLTAPVAAPLVARFGQAAAAGGPDEGLTWACQRGAPVRAPLDAVVDYAGPLKGYGIVLILRAGGAYHLVLAGLGSTQAVAGRPVAAGQIVGRMARDAGRAPELYLEVRRGAEPVDPARFLEPPPAEAPGGPQH